MPSARMAQFRLETLTSIKSAILVLYFILLQFTYHRYFFQVFQSEFCQRSRRQQNYSRIPKGVSPHFETHISSSHNFDITQAKKNEKRGQLAMSKGLLQRTCLIRVRHAKNAFLLIIVSHNLAGKKRRLYDTILF